MRPPHSLSYLPSGWTILSSVLIVLSFPKWDLSPLIWVCLTPWLIKGLAPAAQLRTKLKEALWLGILMSWGGFFWVAYSLKQFGNLPWAVAVVGFLLMSLGNQPQFLAYAFCSHHLFARWPRLAALRSRSPLVFIAICATLYTAIDGLLPKLFQDSLGHAFYRNGWVRQLADLGGVSLLTWLVVWVNGLVACLVDLPHDLHKSTRNTRLRAAACLLLTAIGVCAYGGFRQGQVLERTAAATRKVRFGVIQANIGDFDKVAAESGVAGAATRVLKTYYRMSELALNLTPPPQVIVWPETSYPSTFRTPATFNDRSRDVELEEWVNRVNVPVLFGGYDRENNKDFNSFFFLHPKSLAPTDFGKRQDLQVYHKSILLLFGETIPGAESIQWIRNQFPQVGNFGRGPGPTVLEVRPAGWHPGLPPLRIQPIICYEALFPWFTLGGLAQKADMILNITNDSWFGPHGEPELHLALTTFRSIETRLPQLRATNTGISTLIRTDGEILQPTNLNTEEILALDVPITPPIPTLLGLLTQVSPFLDNWFWRLCLTLSSVTALFAFRKRKPRASGAITP